MRRAIGGTGDEGHTAPLGLHRVLTPDAVAHDTIGVDGLPIGPAAQGLYPVLPQLQSVMWGGGTMEFVTTFRVGDAVERESRLLSLDEKTGRAGRLVFARLQHEYRVAGELCARETETVAFREPAPLNAFAGASDDSQNAAPDLRKEPWDFRREVPTTTVMLFQFSALTFNTHRIHYDQPYATEVEKYPGLLVHGPLTALLLVDTCAAAVGSDRLQSVSVRAQRPAFVGTTFTLAGRKLAGDTGGYELAALDDDGRPVMVGTATLHSSP